MSYFVQALAGKARLYIVGASVISAGNPPALYFPVASLVWSAIVTGESAVNVIIVELSRAGALLSLRTPSTLYVLSNATVQGQTVVFRVVPYFAVQYVVTMLSLLE